MSKNGDQLIDIHSKHTDLCRELNMDKETEKLSWNNYQAIYQKFSLEGDQYHWLCCALYAACRESFTPTVGNSDSVVTGNCVSLTKLLRSCNISIYNFFDKIKNWIDMANLSQNFRNQIERLERSVGVSLVLYEKYNKIFDKLFIIPQNQKKNKKARPGKCSASKLYDFCWCLFLCAKNEEPKHTVDLVTSFQLLLCCIDLIFTNALAENRVDLINPNFSGLPKNWKTQDSSTIDLNFCIMDSLCKMYEASYVEAKTLKQYSWMSIIKKFVQHKTLQSNNTKFIDIISNTNFEPNLKSLNNAYEQYVLSVGEFDERLSLSNASFRRKTGDDTEAEKEKQSQMHASMQRLVPMTPLTRRHHLPSKDVSEPVASATQNVKKLHLIAERDIAKEFLKQAGETILGKLEDRLESMCNIFCEKYPTVIEARERFKLAKALYFYLLEKIVRMELKTKPNLDLKVLLEIELFQTTLIACCVEIVIVAYNSQITFPWILECFHLNAFHFYKIIEIVVARHDDALTRFLIIHLNGIEEKCLDSLVWKSDSPLWTAINESKTPLPSWIHVDNKNSNSIVGSSLIKRIDGSNLERNLLQSPINSAYECFDHTNNNNAGESARRDLFNAAKNNLSERLPSNENSCQNQSVDNPKQITRAGSLSLFFRKFYKLAYMRISELCRELSMKNDEYLKQIWTLFEYSIVHKTELMQDRHLDQILMCAIYVFIRVKDIPDKSFADIMRYYRNQPQATSNIYREVLINPSKSSADGDDNPTKYGDIIQFYNLVYVQKMTPYALNFGDKTKSQSNLLLSPHPPERLLSPKKISSNHHLYIQPLEKKEIPLSPNQITYEFCKSPAKELERINNLVRMGKRNLPFNEEDSITSHKIQKPINTGTQGPYIPRKIHGIIRDRQTDDEIQN